MCDSVVILVGDIRCSSLSGVKGLTDSNDCSFHEGRSSSNLSCQLLNNDVL